MTTKVAPSLPRPMDVPTTPATSMRDINELYEIYDNEEKGTGAFSRVVVCKHRATGVLRAVKIMDRAGLQGKKFEMVQHEKEILRRTRHPNIIALHDCIITEDKVYHVMDLMKDDLFNVIVKAKKIPEESAALIMAQLLSAVSYLHNNSVIHRDIKPENILINNYGDVCLADFGLAKVVAEWDVKNTPCGTSFYIAPEIVRGIESNGAKPLTTNREEVKFIDLWSCGVVLYVMLAGRPPFSGQVKSREERMALLKKIEKGVLFPEAQWANISDDAKDLCSKLLTLDTKTRITATEACHHPFIKAVASKVKTDELRDPEQETETATTTDVADSDEPLDKKALQDGINNLQQEGVTEVDQEGDVSNFPDAQRVLAEESTKVEMKTGVPKRGGK